MSTDFELYYSDNPWENIDKNERKWYDPNLTTLWRRSSVFTPAIPFAMNIGAKNAKSMVVSQFLDPHPDYTPLSLRQIWMPASHIDSRSREISFSRYGGKVAYHEYDDIINYWKVDNKAGLRKIMQGALGTHMVEVMDLLARNAFIDGALKSGYNLNMGGGSDDFSAISTGDTFDPSISNEIWLGMANRNVPAALGPNGAQNNIICFTTPGVIYDMQNNTDASDWIMASEYQTISRYEVGTYKNVRFVQTNRATLFNAGTLIAQAPVTSAITAGDGAPDPETTNVDGAYAVGQDGLTHYIQLATDEEDWVEGGFSDISKNDMVTIHVTRTSDYGVTNGVDYSEGTAHHRRVISIDSGTGRLTLDRPIMIDMDTDLGGGVYAYVTKGRHIHSSIFVGGQQGIVAGVARPPRLHAPPPVDDFGQVFRFSWNGYFGYNLFAPELFEVVFSAGSHRTKGRAAIQ